MLARLLATRGSILVLGPDTRPQPLIQDRVWTKYRLVAQQISSHHLNVSLKIVIAVATRQVMRYSHNLEARDIMDIVSTSEQLKNQIKVTLKSASKSYT